jgi:hypothetical protein
MNIELVHHKDSLEMAVGNILGEEKLVKRFTLIDW